MTSHIIKERTQEIALRIIRLSEYLFSANLEAQRILARQILRSGTLIGANYRAACRAKSTADFINKLKIVEEEADETIYWLELLEKSYYIKEEKIIPLKNEISEILAIVVSTIISSKKKLGKD